MFAHNVLAAKQVKNLRLSGSRTTTTTSLRYNPVVVEYWWTLIAFIGSPEYLAV